MVLYLRFNCLIWPPHMSFAKLQLVMVLQPDGSDFIRLVISTWIHKLVLVFCSVGFYSQSCTFTLYCSLPRRSLLLKWSLKTGISARALLGAVCVNARWKSHFVAFVFATNVSLPFHPLSLGAGTAWKCERTFRNGECEWERPGTLVLSLSKMLWVSIVPFPRLNKGS